MFTILGLMLVLYSLTNWAEHRVLSAFLLFGALLTLAAPGRAPLVLVAALIVSNVATAGTFVRVFEAKRQEQFIWDHRGVNVLQETLEANRVVYRKDQSRWCNTLLTAQEPPHLIAVPAGIGISVVRESDQMSMPPRSRYLLLDESALAHFQRPVRVQPLATLPYGTLYLNLESGCDEWTVSTGRVPLTTSLDRGFPAATTRPGRTHARWGGSGAAGSESGRTYH